MSWGGPGGSSAKRKVQNRVETMQLEEATNEASKPRDVRTSIRPMTMNKQPLSRAVTVHRETRHGTRRRIRDGARGVNSISAMKLARGCPVYCVNMGPDCKRIYRLFYVTCVSLEIN